MKPREPPGGSRGDCSWCLRARAVGRMKRTDAFFDQSLPAYRSRRASGSITSGSAVRGMNGAGSSRSPESPDDYFVVPRVSLALCHIWYMPGRPAGRPSNP